MTKPKKDTKTLKTVPKQIKIKNGKNKVKSAPVPKRKTRARAINVIYVWNTTLRRTQMMSQNKM